jgi:hypothetical protein
VSRTGPALTFALALLLAFLGAVSFTHVCAFAMGAPTENFTIPDPADDTQRGEIKPPVIAVLQGPSAQPESAPPGLTADLMGTSTSGKHTISGNEQWYLDIDINTPGWLYIYEYYPPGGENQGRWIAYKWQMKEPGQWRLGPFRPGDNEPEGRHIYRFFFYGDGQWAAGSSGAHNSSLIYWNYGKGQADTIQPAPVPVTVQPLSTGDRLLKFLTDPLTLLVAPSVIVVMALMVWFASRARRERRSPQNAGRQPQAEPLEQTPEPSQSPLRGSAAAVLELPNGLSIRLVGESEIIGRAQVGRSLGLDELGAISRHHFKISFEDGKPFVEDTGSVNGTTVNGRDIRGAGQVELHDGDVIKMAGKASLKFRAN